MKNAAMCRGDYAPVVTTMLQVFICGEKYLLFVLSEFLWIDVVGVKKEVAQREQAARAERNGGMTTALDGHVSLSRGLRTSNVRVMACKSSWR